MYDGEEQDYSKFNTSVKIPEDKVKPDTREKKKDKKGKKSKNNEGYEL